MTGTKPLLEFAESHVTRIPVPEGQPRRVHVWDRESIDAVNAAWAAQRPLLVRGEPGVGKSQLALAAAVETSREFVMETVHLRTEPNDLLWRFDAVARLAEAQVLGALIQSGSLDETDVDKRLALERFVHPGLLWWAFSWGSAQATEGECPPASHPSADAANGVVALIDEIDKADAAVPNSLLQALGDQRFRPPGRSTDIALDGPRPLVVITTNEERSLPNAFLRRCLVLFLELEKEPARLIEQLVERARSRFPDEQRLSDRVLEIAAKQLVDDREEVKNQGLSLPGQAEYLDLLEALAELGVGEDEQMALLERTSRFVYRKHPASEAP